MKEEASEESNRFPSAEPSAAAGDSSDRGTARRIRRQKIHRNIAFGKADEHNHAAKRAMRGRNGVGGR